MDLINQTFHRNEMFSETSTLQYDIRKYVISSVADNRDERGEESAENHNTSPEAE